MMLEWFNCKAVDEFADSIAADLMKRVPPTGIEAPAKKAAQRLRKTHDAVFGRIEKFARAQKLNIYKKSRLGTRLKWALLDAGYPIDFVDTLTLELLTVVTLVSRKGAKASS